MASRAPAAGGASPVAGVGVPVVDGWRLFGDSLPQGGSGGPGQYFDLQLGWYRGPLGLPGAVANDAVSGETSTQAKNRAIARTVQEKNLLFWAGRNDGITANSQAALVATLTANLQAVIASLVPGQTLWLLAIHNMNYNAEFDADPSTVKEGSGSSRYNKIIAMNNALAGLANGSTVRYLDSRALLVQHAVRSNFQDGLDYDEDMPASSTTAPDGTHPNSVGYNEIVRSLVWAEYVASSHYATRTNLVTDTGMAAWTLKDSATGSYSAGEYNIAAVSAFGGMGQQLLASGASGKTFLFHWNMRTPVGLASIVARPAIGGGSNFPAASPFLNPYLYGYSIGGESAGLNMAARNQSLHQMIFVTANDPALTWLWQAQNDASATWKPSVHIAHQIA